MRREGKQASEAKGDGWEGKCFSAGVSESVTQTDLGREDPRKLVSDGVSKEAEDEETAGETGEGLPSAGGEARGWGSLGRVEGREAVDAGSGSGGVDLLVRIVPVWREVRRIHLWQEGGRR
jgi:hypothetical protein